MSEVTNEGNPWLSLSDLLPRDIPVATLANVIESNGIQTYDRFGRRIPATDDGSDVKVSRARALDLLAAYYKETQDNYDLPPGCHPKDNPDRWFEYDSPLIDFGWPADEAPDFDKVSQESRPAASKSGKPNIDAPPSARARRTYITVIAALCVKAGIDYKIRGAAQEIKQATEMIGARVPARCAAALVLFGGEHMNTDILAPLLSRVCRTHHWIRRGAHPSHVNEPLTDDAVAQHLNGGYPTPMRMSKLCTCLVKSIAPAPMSVMVQGRCDLCIVIAFAGIA